MDSLGRFFAILMAIVLVILLPLQYLGHGHGERIDGLVSEKVSEFTHTARHQGHITLDMYEDMVDYLDHTGELYEVSMEVAHPVSGKEVAYQYLGEDRSDISLDFAS